jgi:P-type E1-E2 ATPase
VIATSGRAVEAAGDVDVLLLDKTGTITDNRWRWHVAR